MMNKIFPASLLFFYKAAVTNVNNLLVNFKDLDILVLTYEELHKRNIQAMKVFL